MGCPVCGRGVDWSLWPDARWLRTGTVLYSFVVGWMRYEYLCYVCMQWARAAGAEWDGSLKIAFTGFKVTERTIDPRSGAPLTPGTNAPVIRSRYCPGGGAQ